jgi:hypothetical protein
VEVCYQKSHHQNDCPLLKQFRLDNAKKRDQGQASNAEEAGNVAIAEEFDSDLIYTTPDCAMLATTSPT